VEVSVGGAVLDKSSADLGTFFPPTFLPALPIFVRGGIRDPQSPVTYAPTVRNGGTESSINGGPLLSKEILLDGSSHTSPEAGGVSLAFPAPEQFSEFRVLTSAYGAEYGLGGARVLDAGCGAGPMSIELAARGARVIANDISPRLLDVARDRTPAALKTRIDYIAGDMLDPGLGCFDFVVAMDSLIHYRADHIAQALSGLAKRTVIAIVFTVAPRTPVLSAMHLVGKLFPRGDRSPAIVPQDTDALARTVARTCGRRLELVGRVATGFYISQAMEMRP
jgi:magnesium-protoporphyrin O-methyltransferase